MDLRRDVLYVLYSYFKPYFEGTPKSRDLRVLGLFGLRMMRLKKLTYLISGLFSLQTGTGLLFFL